jgi:hypothetical protein
VSEDSEKISKEKFMIAGVVLAIAVLLFVIGTKSSPKINNVKPVGQKIEKASTSTSTSSKRFTNM